MTTIISTQKVNGWPSICLILSSVVRFSKARDTLLACLFFTAAAAFSFITPPFQAPDEPSHFFRAYQVSEGIFLSHKLNENIGGELPITIESSVTPFGNLPFHSSEKIKVEYFRHTLESAPQLNKNNDRHFVAFPSSAVNSPVPYLPAALAIAIVRFLGGSVYYAFYAGRFITVIFVTILLYCSLKALNGDRHFQLGWFTIAGLPMSVFLTGSLSADALTIGFSLLTIALGISIQRDSRRGKLFIYLMSAAALSLCKSVYGLIGLIALPRIIFDKSREASVKWWAAGYVVCASLLPGVIWNILASHFFVPWRPYTLIDPHLQFLNVLSHPFTVMPALFIDILKNIPSHVEELIGVLGWLDTRLHYVPRLGFATLLFTTFIFSIKNTGRNEGETQANQVSAAVIFFVVSCLIYAAMFLSWTPLNSLHIEGVQGRYFLPILPLLFTIVRPIKLKLKYYEIFFTVWIVTWLYFITRIGKNILDRYWLF